MPREAVALPKPSAPKYKADRSIIVCFTCANVYQLVDEKFRPMRNTPLGPAPYDGWTRCPFCENSDLRSPPNTTHNKYLKEWVYGRLPEIQRLASQRHMKVPDDMLWLLVHKSPVFGWGAQVVDGPRWLKLVKGDPFSQKEDARIVSGPRLIVPGSIFPTRETNALSDVIAQARNAENN